MESRSLLVRMEVKTLGSIEPYIKRINIISSLKSHFYIPKKKSKQHKIFRITRSCWFQKYVLFSNQVKLRHFTKICMFFKFRSAILNISWVLIFSKNYTATIRTKIKIFWKFDKKNLFLFTADLAVQVWSLLFLI